MVKKNFLLLLMAFFTLSIVSCKDDDKYLITDTDVNGVYSGTLDVGAPWQGGQLGANGIKQKIYITKTGENLVKLELKNFVFNNIPVGTIEINDIAVDKVGNDFLLQGSGKLTLIVGGCDANVRGTVYPDGNCRIIIDVNVTSKGDAVDFVGLNVNVDFNGKKLAADQSSEALIKNFDFNSDSVTNVTISASGVLFYVTAGMTNHEFTPAIEISAGATITPASGVVQDFSKPVTYTVVSEDGITSVKYVVSKAGKIKTYDFSGKWNTVGTYEEPDGMTTSNSATNYFFIFGIDKLPLPVSKVEENGVTVAQVRSRYTVSTTMPNGLVPAITAATLFNGKFEITDPDNPLTSTLFGEPFVGKPLTFEFVYKYTAGDKYYKTVTDEESVNSGELIPGMVDSCSVNAYLYEVDDYSESLDGTNINSPGKVILKAALADGSAKAEYTTQKIEFKETGAGKYDAAKKYKLAIVCSSSKYGDKFMGGDGSVLSLKSIKVVAE